VQVSIKFCVDLSQSERDQLDALLSGGRRATRKIKRAQILLAANDGVSDEVIAAKGGGIPATLPRLPDLRAHPRRVAARCRRPSPHPIAGTIRHPQTPYRISPEGG